MGWSCNAAAALTLDAIQAHFNAQAAANGIEQFQNIVVKNGKKYGFWEGSRREHADGAITGTVWRYVDEMRVSKAGSFRIEGNGSITRFTGLSTSEMEACECKGAAEYQRRYGA